MKEIQFNSIPYLLFTNFGKTWEVSLWADKKKNTKGNKTLT